MNAAPLTYAFRASGFFNDTIPVTPVQHIAFLRLDGDLYQSTLDVLTGLYDKVIPGGYIYVDDFNSFAGCREAIHKFRTERRIYEPLHLIFEADGRLEAAWWRKETHYRGKA